MIFELLKFVSDSLNERNIPFMISGGIALNAYAVPRLTRDIDIVIELGDHQISDIIDVFHNDFYLDPDTVESEVKRKGMFNVIDHKSGFKIDFIVRKQTEYRQLEFSRRLQTDIFGFKTWIVTIEDLIISKLEWIQVLQSEKQVGDIKALLENPVIDLVYLKKWCRKLSLNTFNIFPNE